MGRYASEAQRRFFHTDTARRAGITAAEVKKRDEASRGANLPERKSMKIKAKVKIRRRKA